MQIKTPDQLASHVYHQLREQLLENQAAGNMSTTILAGLSGGLDSVVLLHLLKSIDRQLDSARISAIHVNHGIHNDSSDWAEFCQQYCDALGVELHISQHRLKSVTSNREAVFRRHRYRVFSDHLPKSGLLLTAHHLNDQAETILFNLFRGAGLKGLRGMKQRIAFASGVHIRPLLAAPRRLLCEYAENHHLKWIDDPSNDDVKLDRNFIRHHVIPVIERRWPAGQSSIARSGANLIQTEQIIDEVGHKDIEFCRQPDHPGVIENAYISVLNLSRMDQLSRARQFNALRLWILTSAAITVTADQLQQIHQDLCTQPSSGLFELEGYQLRVFKNCLYLMPAMPKSPQRIEKPQINDDSFIFRNLSLRVHLQAKTGLNPGSALRFAHRQGGEKIRHHGQNQRLKSIYQQRLIPTWEREIIPLIFEDNQLIAVPGVVLSDDGPFEKSSVSKYKD